MREHRPLSLLVRNLRYTTSPDRVRKFFEQFGEVRDVYLPLDFYTRSPRGFGFVKFCHDEHAEEALRALRSDAVLDGAKISVTIAQQGRKSPESMRRRERINRAQARGSDYDSRYRDRSRSYSYRREDRSRRSRSRSPYDSAAPRHHHHHHRRYINDADYEDSRSHYRDGYRSRNHRDRSPEDRHNAHSRDDYQPSSRTSKSSHRERHLESSESHQDYYEKPAESYHDEPVSSSLPVSPQEASNHQLCDEAVEDRYS